MFDLRNMDCMEMMAEFPDKHFDLACVDPPYGIKMNGGVNYGRPSRPNQYKSIRPPKHAKKEWDNERPNAEYWKEIFRVSKNQIVFGANYFVDFLKPSMGWVYWGKFEDDSNFSDGELIYTSFNRALRSYYLHPFDGTNGGKARIHPTQKPVALYKWLLKNYAKPNDKILDTYLGSASIALAVHSMNTIEKMNLSLTGCEIDPDYFKESMERLRLSTKQTTIFDEV